MTKVREIEEAIEGLSPSEVEQLASWFEARFQDHWDRQLDADSASGSLDALYDHLVAEDGPKDRVALDEFLDDQKLS